MTPAETITILRQFNEWRRCDEDIPQPDTREIGEAIDAAVEMIERLEAAERSDAESIAMYRKARDERDELRAKIEQMERQAPVAEVESWTNGSYSRNYKLRWLKDVAEGERLYALPGAKGE